MPKLKTLKSLPKADIRLVEPPPLQRELPHQVLARLTAEQERLTKEIQDHKAKWAERNILSQRTREPVSTPEITAFKQHHRDLSCALAEVQLKIGEVNRELRANKAARQNGHRTELEPVSEVKSSTRRSTKDCPLKSRPDWNDYFVLAAKNELTPDLYAQIERSTKSLLNQALSMGVAQ